VFGNVDLHFKRQSLAACILMLRQRRLKPLQIDHFSVKKSSENGKNFMA
jgi:hypothetical protein